MDKKRECIRADVTTQRNGVLITFRGCSWMVNGQFSSPLHFVFIVLNRLNFSGTIVVVLLARKIKSV